MQLRPVAPLPAVVARISGKSYAFDANPLEIEELGLAFPGSSEAVMLIRRDGGQALTSVSLRLQHMPQTGMGCRLPIAQGPAGPDAGFMSYDRLSTIEIPRLSIYQGLSLTQI
jgi:hypothetical protein